MQGGHILPNFRPKKFKRAPRKNISWKNKNLSGAEEAFKKGLLFIIFYSEPVEDVQYKLLLMSHFV
jgi:hypothetical protein